MKKLIMTVLAVLMMVGAAHAVEEAETWGDALAREAGEVVKTRPAQLEKDQIFCSVTVTEQPLWLYKLSFGLVGGYHKQRFFLVSAKQHPASAAVEFLFRVLDGPYQQVICDDGKDQVQWDLVTTITARN